MLGDTVNSLAVQSDPDLRTLLRAICSHIRGRNASWAQTLDVKRPNQITTAVRSQLLHLESIVLPLLELLVSSVDQLWIVTNADHNWILDSSKVFMPTLCLYIEKQRTAGKITTSSARSLYEKEVGAAH